MEVLIMATESEDQAKGIEGDDSLAGDAGAPPLLKRIWSLSSRAAAWRSRDGEPKARKVLQLCDALLSERGEVSGARVAAELLAAYRALDRSARGVFFDMLNDSFLPNPEQVAEAADAYRKAPAANTLLRLEAAAEPPRRELFRRLNLAPGGTAALIEMRRHLLATLRDHPERAGIDGDLAYLFKSWFNGGFLILRRIDWRTSAVVLERLIQYEAVHQIQGWDDLRRRLEADRRCYALFHPALAEEPLIFIEVALTERISAHVHPLLDPNAAVLDPARARCAVFYSITHCQEGLRGISFGSLLIKQVVEDLTRSFPRIARFATLSPIPDFHKWLATEYTDLLDSLEMRAARLKNEPIAADLRDELVRLCAFYLTHARHGRVPFDSVARFHLANGARLERLNWLADTSESGIRRSFGLMANYVYRLEDLERNHESYAREYKVVASRQIERLAKQARLTDRTAAR
jgi:malonyl-CoA decarboxylase